MKSHQQAGRIKQPAVLWKNRNESISRTLPVRSVTIYKTPFFSLFPSPTFPSLSRTFSSSLSFFLFRITCRGRGLQPCFTARLTNSMSLNASLCCAMLSRRRQEKLSAAIIHECPAISRDVRLVGCYFGSRVLRKCCVGARISATSPMIPWRYVSAT